MLYLAGFAVGCFVVSLGEYWIHRLQHWQMIKGTNNEDQHERNEARGILREYWSYVRHSSLIIIPTTFASYCWLTLDSTIGWLSGILGYMIFSAWSHEIQHTDPNLVFWSKPLHYIHHNRTPNKNFGFTFCLWDRLFRTYEAVEWKRAPIPWSDYLKVKWR